MRRIVCEWTGPAIKGRAVTVLNFQEETVDPTVVSEGFFQSMSDIIPTGTQIRMPNSGDTISPSTGKLTGTWTSASASLVVNCRGAAAAAAGVGACITWLTDGIGPSRRIKGRTFIVPLGNDVYEADGTLTAFALGKFQNAGQWMVDNGLMVHHRPSSKGASDGSQHDVVAYKVSDKVAFLSSRRD